MGSKIICIDRDQYNQLQSSIAETLAQMVDLKIELTKAQTMAELYQKEIEYFKGRIDYLENLKRPPINNQKGAEPWILK